MTCFGQWHAAERTAEPGSQGALQRSLLPFVTLHPPRIEIQAGPLEEERKCRKKPQVTGITNCRDRGWGCLRPPRPRKPSEDCTHLRDSQQDRRAGSGAETKLLTHRTMSKQKWFLMEDTELRDDLLRSHKSLRHVARTQTWFPFPNNRFQ